MHAPPRVAAAYHCRLFKVLRNYGVAARQNRQGTVRPTAFEAVGRRFESCLVPTGLNKIKNHHIAVLTQCLESILILPSCTMDRHQRTRNSRLLVFAY